MITVVVVGTAIGEMTIGGMTAGIIGGDHVPAPLMVVVAAGDHLIMASTGGGHLKHQDECLLLTVWTVNMRIMTS